MHAAFPLLALGLLLAGCAEGGLSFEEDGLANDSGTDSGTRDCGDHATLHATLKGTGGMVEVTVLDGAGARAADRVTFAGDHEGEMDLQGAPGAWTVQLRRAGFSGDYTVRLAC